MIAALGKRRLAISTRMLAVACTLVFAAVAVSIMVPLTRPAIYLSAMGTVLFAELLLIAVLLRRRVKERRHSVSQRRMRSAGPRAVGNDETALIQQAIQRIENGFIDEPRALLEQILADVDHSDDERALAELGLKHAQAAPSGSGLTVEFDVVIVSNLNLPGGTTASNANEIRLLTESGKTVGLFHHPLYSANTGRTINAKILDLVDGESVRLIDPGAKVSCALLIMRFPPFATRLRDDLPEIDADEKILVVNQAPMMYYDAVGGRKQVWDPPTVMANLSNWIGEHRWLPVGPAIHRALVDHHREGLTDVEIADDYWYPVLDLTHLRQRASGGAGERIRIGRHSRDHVSKWPELAADLRACYPETPATEVRVLGGAGAARRILGRLPSNWRVSAFDSMPVQDFLAELDFYVYYPNSALLEAFGRGPAEAMATGVPVILPPEFEPVFGSGAVYAPPAEVTKVVAELAEDESSYLTQQKRGAEAVRQRFGPEAHRERLRSVGVAL
jgi:hypothetical protein